MKLLALLILGVWLVGVVPLQADTIQPLKAAVFRSTGTQFLGQTIWPELNAGWSEFGNVPVEIDWWSLAGSNITDAKLEGSGADVLIISAAGYTTYTDAEIDAITRYVESGHGIIITYFSFYQNKRRLAPLVGLSDTITLGTGTFRSGMEFNAQALGHPVLGGLVPPYESGTTYMAVPASDGVSWAFSTGEVVADTYAASGSLIARGLIVANEQEDYRGLYFAHYVENKADGANLQDMQVFYNALLWTAGVPEPSTAAMLAGAGFLALWRGRKPPHKR